MSLEAILRDHADTAGMAGFGIGAPDAFPEVERALRDAVADGRSGSLRFTFATPETSSDPMQSFPWARSAVVLAHAYLPGAGDPGPARPGTGRIARFATEDHYRPLRRALTGLAELLRGRGHRAEVLCDDNRVVDRALAVRSGVAWWGKSSMVLAPGVGPWLLLGSVLTDAVMDRTEPMQRDCGTCEACLPACPTGAIVAPGVVDARLCLAAVLQSAGPIPHHLREALGDRWYGCDECLASCPPGARLMASGSSLQGRVDLHEVLGTADRPLRESHAHFYVPRNEGRYLRRNAIVALANSPAPGSDLILAGYLGNGDPLLRSHAAWALGRVGGPRAIAALRYAAGVENDESVSAEIDLALGTLT